MPQNQLATVYCGHHGEVARILMPKRSIESSSHGGILACAVEYEGFVLYQELRLYALST